MLPLPHSIFPGAVFPAIPQTDAAVLLAVQAQLNASERLPPEELRALQFRQIGELVAQIDRAVPHYGVSLRRAGVAPGRPITPEAWARVPILTRSDVQAAAANLHAREVPKGHGRIGSATTSGSSGRPVTLRKTGLSQLYWQCFTLREELWHRRDISAVATGIRRDDAPDVAGPLRRLPGWGAPLSTVYPTGPSLLLDYRATIAVQAETLLRERPAYLTTFPSLLLELVRSGVRPDGLREVRTVGEALAPEVRNLCRERWGVRITDIYSAAEIGVIAFECPEHGHYHVQSESVLVEVLHPDGTACAPGETGQVVLTPLDNFAMPLIRYAIDDLAEVGEPCPCGRTLPVLARIPGRARDMLVLPSGERRFPYYGHAALVGVDAVVQHQVAQVARDEVEIRLVLRRPLGDAESTQIRAAVTTALGGAFRVRLAERDAISRDASGKYAEFRYEVPPP